MSFINRFFPRCSSNCIQQSEDNAEFKDALSYLASGCMVLSRWLGLSHDTRSPLYQQRSPFGELAPFVDDLDTNASC